MASDIIKLSFSQKCFKRKTKKQSVNEEYRHWRDDGSKVYAHRIMFNVVKTGEVTNLIAHTKGSKKTIRFLVFSCSSWFTVIIVIYKKPKFMDSMKKPKVFYQAEITHADGSVNS